MPGRQFNSNQYSYGYNGMMKDDKGCGCGGDYTTEYRQLDTRLGRWWSIDPAYQKFPSESPYSVNLNNPILLNDPKGDCPVCLLIGIAAFVVDVSMQASVSYAVNPEAGWEAAFSSVDYFDAAITGVVAAGTAGMGAEVTLGNTANNTLLRVVSQQTVKGEILKATIDYKPGADGEQVKVAIINKSGVETALDFTFGTIGGKATDKIIESFKVETKAGVDAFEKYQKDAKWLDPDLKQAIKLNNIAESAATKEVTEKTIGGMSGMSNEAIKNELNTGTPSQSGSSGDNGSTGGYIKTRKTPAAPTYGTSPAPK